MKANNYILFFVDVINSCKTIDQFETACNWIGSMIGRSPNVALDYDYNIKQARLMPVYRALVYKASDLGVMASTYFNLKG